MSIYKHALVQRDLGAIRLGLFLEVTVGGVGGCCHPQGVPMETGGKNMS